MTIEELIIAAKVMLQAKHNLSLDDEVWSMLGKHVEQKIFDMLIVENIALDDKGKLNLLVTNAEKYAAVSKSPKPLFAKPMILPLKSTQPKPFLVPPVEDIEELNEKFCNAIDAGVEGNLSTGPERPRRTPLFEPTPPPDGYQVQRRTSLAPDGGAGYWSVCTQVYGNRYSHKFGREMFYSRKLPWFYKRKTSAEKVMKELKDYRPEREYRIRNFWLSDDGPYGRSVP